MPFYPFLAKRQKTLRELHDDAVKKKVELKQEKNEVKEEQRGPGSYNSVIAKQARISTKNAYVLIMDEYVPHVTAAFNLRSLACCTSISVFQKLRKEMQRGIFPIEVLSEVARYLLFVRNSEDTLEQTWTSEEGKLASKMKRSVMLCNLNMARRNVFGNFSEDGAEDKPEIPRWLTEKVKVRNDRDETQDYIVGGKLRSAWTSLRHFSLHGRTTTVGLRYPGACIHCVKTSLCSCLTFYKVTSSSCTQRQDEQPA